MEAFEIKEGDFYMSKRKCQEYHKKHHGRDSVKKLNDPDTYIKTQEEGDVLFKDQHGVPIKTFKIVNETPIGTLDRSDFYIQVYFLTQHKIFKVRFLGLLPHLSELQQRVLVAFMRDSYDKASHETLAMDARHSRFCEAVGDDPLTRTVEQEQEKQLMAQENPDFFVGSFIYSDVEK